MSQKEHGEVRSTSGTLKGTYHYLDSPSPHLFPFVFISNVTDSLQMFRVCKNGKPIAFPLPLKVPLYTWLDVPMGFQGMGDSD